MLPFGNTPFGRGYFGRGDWGTRVFWENVPSEHRVRDTDGDLENLLQAWGDEFDAIMGDVRVMPQQKDPWLARAQEGGEWMFVTDCVIEIDDALGEVVKLIGAADPSDLPTEITGADWLPYTELDQVGNTWEAVVGDGRWPVVNVRTRNVDDGIHTPYVAATSLGNEVWCRMGTLLPFVYTNVNPVVIGVGDGTATPLVQLPVDAWITTGSLAVTIVCSAGTVVASDDSSGHLRVGGIIVGQISYTTGAITINLATISETATMSQSITATYEVTGYFIRMRKQPMLEWLHQDFGIVADRDVPDWVQRAALIHYRWYMGQKGSTPAYEMLGSIYLFDVTATGLWEVCTADQIADYPVDQVFVTGLGALARYFTTIAPRRLRYDDIAGDALYYDSDTATWIHLLDREVLYGEDATPAAWSIAKRFAVDVSQGYPAGAGRMPCVVQSATPLDATDLAMYGLTFAQRVVVSMMPVQWAEFNMTGRGIWSLSPYDRSAGVPPSFTGAAWYIDIDEGYDVDTEEWTVILGSMTAPPVGSDVALRYWPPVDLTDCCYCRTSYILFNIAPSALATAYYGSDISDGSRLVRARERLESRIQNLLIPCHIRVFGTYYTLPSF